MKLKTTPKERLEFETGKCRRTIDSKTHRETDQAEIIKNK